MSHSKLKNSRQNKYHTLSFHLNNYFNFELNCIIKYDHTTTNMFLNWQTFYNAAFDKTSSELLYLNVFSFGVPKCREHNALKHWPLHCVKCVQIRSIFWSVFSRIWTEYEVSLRIQSKGGKIRTRKYSVFKHFSRSVIGKRWPKIY